MKSIIKTGKRGIVAILTLCMLLGIALAGVAKQQMNIGVDNFYCERKENIHG